MALKHYIKRVYYWLFYREKILESLRTRKGECNQCGKCCIVFGNVKCLFLSKDNKCSIYRFRPFILCRLPPLNIFPEQVERFKKYGCGYHWTD